MLDRYVGWEDGKYYVLVAADEWWPNDHWFYGTDVVLSQELEDTHFAGVDELYPLPFIERLKTAIGYRLRIAWQRPYALDLPRRWHIGIMRGRPWVGKYPF